MTPSAQTAGGRRVRRWTRELIIEKILEWKARYGEPPCSADWNPSLARWRAQEWRAERYREGVWPSTNAAKRPFGGSFDAAVRAAGLEPHRPGPRRRAARAARPRVEPSPRNEIGELLERIVALERALLVADARAERAEAKVSEARRRARRAATRHTRDRVRVARAPARELSTLVADGRPRLTSGELSELRQGGPSGPAVLAVALRKLARARAAGDYGAQASALAEIASAAVRWRDRI
jgi:hypothetical protein